MTSMHFPNTKGMDEDEAQEFVCLMLEGYSEADAKRMARSANDKVNGRRLSGPLTGESRTGRGVRPLVSDMWGAQYETVISLGADTRSMDERHDDWDADIRNQELVARVKDALTERQWEFLTIKFGLEGCEAARSIKELADRMGISVGVANKYLPKIRASLARKGIDFV